MLALTLLTPGDADAVPPDRPQGAAATAEAGPIAALVERQLAKIDAATASDLVDGAVARKLVAAASFSLPYGNGKAVVVVVGLAELKTSSCVGASPGCYRVPAGAQACGL